MAKEITFKRRICEEEKRGRYLFLTKDRAKLFPKPNIPFKIKFQNTDIPTSIQVVDCWCKGPRDAHVHYHLDLRSLTEKTEIKHGQTLHITIQGKGNYQISF